MITIPAYVAAAYDEYDVALETERRALADAERARVARREKSEQLSETIREARKSGDLPQL